ncbi:MAG: site-specific integrase, partial [Synergistes sp.]|nr:site-specific integrase [Synergistes sp.]
MNLPAEGELGKTIGRFTDYLRLERGCSENTQRAYISDMKIWLAFCEEQKHDPTDVDYDMVRRFILYQQREGKSKSSVQRIGAMLRSFAKFLQYDGVTDELPILEPLPSRTKKLPQVMT